MAASLEPGRAAEFPGRRRRPGVSRAGLRAPSPPGPGPGPARRGGAGGSSLPEGGPGGWVPPEEEPAGRPGVRPAGACPTRGTPDRADVRPAGTAVPPAGAAPAGRTGRVPPGRTDRVPPGRTDREAAGRTGGVAAGAPRL